jgi:hypothetical protein
MVSARCSECGACYAAAADSCQARFDALLALDHSRREPWGSRHALAFAAFALQHPRSFPARSVTRARELLERVFLRHEPLAAVVRDYRARPRDQATTPSSSPQRAVRGFAVTIADLGDFDVDTYPALLERWCLASLTSHDS